jgi:hypothetical protein
LATALCIVLPPFSPSTRFPPLAAATGLLIPVDTQQALLQTAEGSKWGGQWYVMSCIRKAEPPKQEVLASQGRHQEARHIFVIFDGEI